MVPAKAWPFYATEKLGVFIFIGTFNDVF